MRKEINVQTGEVKELPDAPVTWEVSEPTYVEKRAMAYKPLAEQLDMQYWDKVNGTNLWKEHIDSVKAAHPKPTE